MFLVLVGFSVAGVSPAAQTGPRGGHDDAVRVLHDAGHSCPLRGPGHAQDDGLQQPVKCPARPLGRCSYLRPEPARLVFRARIRRRPGSSVSDGIVEALGPGATGRDFGPFRFQRDINARLLQLSRRHEGGVRKLLAGHARRFSRRSPRESTPTSRVAWRRGAGLPIEFQIAGFEPEPGSPRTA